jgi:acyl carrier protein
MGLAASKLDVQQPLTNMGIDSLMAIEVKNQVEAELHVVIPVVQFLQGPTIAQLSAQVLKQLTEAVPAATRRAASAAVLLQAAKPEGRGDLSTSISVEEAQQLLANLDQLSDREVEALLTDLLAEEENE